MTRNRVFITLLFWLGLSLNAAHAGPIERAEAAIQAIASLTADFTQIASDGTSDSGKLYLRRPFQMRIDYNGSNPITLVATRLWLHVDNPRDRSVTSYPISQTPLGILLQNKVRLRGDDFTTSVAAADGITQIILRRETGEAAGTLTLEFETSSFRLRRWVVEDAVGVTTAVTLQNEIYGQKLDNRLFATPIYEVNN